MKKPFAVTLDIASSLANHTGSWRASRPEYVDLLPPCNATCPAGEDIQGWLYLAEEGSYRQAWQRLMRDNPFPGIMGRACYSPCEGACNRAKLDSAVGIRSVERFLGDRAIAEGWALDPDDVASDSGKRVLVVGAGPSGLAAAYHLRRFGHGVVIHEAASMAGGMMRFGIPKYRLSRETLDAEVARILSLGVDLRLSTPVTDLTRVMHDGGFDACFVAVGAHIAKRIEIPSSDETHILDALALLRTVEIGDSVPRLGRRVVVYGGGNTAIDAARTAKRLGAEDAVVVYRRTREQMPAHDFEVQEAEEEGVAFRWLSTIQRVDGERICVERMVLDEHGRPKPTGEFETLEADAVVLAVGQSVDARILAGVSGIRWMPDGTVDVDSHMMTGHAGIFAGGDMVPAERSIAVAVGHGKKAAHNIDAFLRGQVYEPQPKHDVAGYETLNTWYYADADRTVQPVLEHARRASSFAEVHSGLDADHAQFEARRCLSCGNCFECDNCFGMCPDNAIVKLGPGNRFRINLDYCKGCGICATECPCGAVKMVPEEL